MSCVFIVRHRRDGALMFTIDCRHGSADSTAEVAGLWGIITTRCMLDSLADAFLASQMACSVVHVHRVARFEVHGGMKTVFAERSGRYVRASPGRPLRRG